MFQNGDTLQNKLHNSSVHFDTQKGKVPGEYLFCTKRTRSTTMNHQAPRKMCSQVACSSKIRPQKEKLVPEEEGAPMDWFSHQSCSSHLQNCKQRLCPGKYFFLLRSGVTEHTSFLRNELAFVV